MGGQSLSQLFKDQVHSGLVLSQSRGQNQRHTTFHMLTHIYGQLRIIN